MFSIDPLIASLGRALDLSALRHAVHAANIANVDTEGYSRLEVALGAEQGAVASADDPNAEPRIVAVAGETVRLDEEMARLAQNAVRYQTLLAAIEKSMSTLRYAARDGRE